VPRLTREWRVPAAFALLTVGRLVYVAPSAWFWHYGDHTLPVVAALVLVLLGFLLLRSRFAWWLFIVFSGIGLVSRLANVSGHGITSAWVFGVLFDLVYLGLLVSPPMRRFVGVRPSLSAAKRVSLGIASSGFSFAGKSFEREVRYAERRERIEAERASRVDS
jgi:hypothetical protein